MPAIEKQNINNNSDNLNQIGKDPQNEKLNIIKNTSILSLSPLNVNNENHIKPHTPIHTKLKDLKRKEIVLNKEINKVINSRTKKTHHVKISTLNRLNYIYCCGASKIDRKSLSKWVYTIENELSKKCDFIEISRLLDQFRLLKKVMINEGQCLLLKNRDFSKINERDFNLESEYNGTYKEIVEYMKARKESGLMNQIDLLLFNYMKQEIKEKVNEQINNG